MSIKLNTLEYFLKFFSQKEFDENINLFSKPTITFEEARATLFKDIAGSFAISPSILGGNKSMDITWPSSLLVLATREEPKVLEPEVIKLDLSNKRLLRFKK